MGKTRRSPTTERKQWTAWNQLEEGFERYTRLKRCVSELRDRLSKEHATRRQIEIYALRLETRLLELGEDVPEKPSYPEYLHPFTPEESDAVFAMISCAHKILMACSEAVSDLSEEQAAVLRNAMETSGILLT